ncbi:MAG: amidohydrolase [Gammaproteobacteria bacterium]|nr:amidohydrolase [Gammaproteobacteria bacterium]
MKRREFMQTTASVAGLSFVSCGLGALAACTENSQASGRRRVVVNGKQMRTVDIHCHSYVHDVWPLVESHEDLGYLLPVVNTAPLKNKLDIYNVDFRLQQMDEQGIDVQAVSLHVGQYHHWADRDLAAEIISIQNGKIAELCAAHPERFVGLGAVALQHPDLAVEQMRHAISEYDMRGFMITGSVNGEELSNPKFHPFLGAAEELGTVIFIHPRNFPAGQSRLEGNGKLDNVIGNPLETTVALSHLIFDGTLDKYPGLKICAAHGGGYLPSYIGRSDHCVENWPDACKPVDKLPSAYLKQLYFDSLVYSTENLRHLIRTVGADRIVIGTDFPFNMSNKDSVDHLMSVSDLSAAEQEAILGGTAAQLLGIV